MVSTVWSVFCLLFFYSRCPRAKPFVKYGTRAPVPQGIGATELCKLIKLKHGRSPWQCTIIVSTVPISCGGVGPPGAREPWHNVPVPPRRRGVPWHDDPAELRDSPGLRNSGWVHTAVVVMLKSPADVSTGAAVVTPVTTGAHDSSLQAVSAKLVVFELVAFEVVGFVVIANVGVASVVTLSS